MRDAFLKYWRGILLTALGAGATIWLALSGQLGLYIHPRYFAFTVVMAAIAVAFVVVTLLIPRQRDHDHEEPVEPRRTRRRRGRLAGVASGVLVLLTAVLLALPPTTLTGSLASGRDLNAAGITGGEDALQLAQADPAGFTIKDWAVLIADGASSRTLESVEPQLVGFVIADPDQPESTFAVARYVITCCAVDAQPVGVTVRLPGWQERFASGSWVQAQGRFVPQDDGWVLEASSAEPVDQPAEPYVY